MEEVRGCWNRVGDRKKNKNRKKMIKKGLIRKIN